MAEAEKPVFRYNFVNNSRNPRGVYEAGKSQPTIIPVGASVFVSVHEGEANSLDDMAHAEPKAYQAYRLDENGKRIARPRRAAAAPRALAAGASLGPDADADDDQDLDDDADVSPAASFLLGKGIPQDDLTGMTPEEIEARALALGYTAPPPEADAEPDEFEDFDDDGLRAYLTAEKVEFHPRLGRARLLEAARAHKANKPAEEAV